MTNYFQDLTKKQFQQFTVPPYKQTSNFTVQYAKFAEGIVPPISKLIPSLCT